jgi:membrane fusion protein, heavy metal efflux system
LNSSSLLTCSPGLHPKSKSRKRSDIFFRFAFALFLGLVLSVEQAQSQQLNLTAAQIKGAGIVTVKPELLNRAGKEVTLNGSFSTSRAGGVAVNSMDAATVAEIFKDNLSDVKVGEPLLRLTSEAWLRYQQEHVQNSTALNLAQQGMNRDKALFEDGLIPKRRMLEAQGQLTMVNAAYQNSRQMLKLMGAGGGEISQIEKTGRITANLVVRAPVAGSLSGMTWMLGQQVAPGSTLLQITKPGGLELQLSASPEQSNMIKPGQVVRFTACNGQSLPLGTVLGIGSELTVGNQTIPVRVKLNSNPQALSCYKVNQFVSVSVETGASADLSGFDFKVPDTAVAYIGSQAYVFAKSADGFQAIAVNSKRLSSNSFAINANAGAANKNIGVLKANSDLASSGSVLLKGVLQGLGAE